MFNGKEITSETVDKLLELEKDKLRRMMDQVSGVVRNGLKNESVTALTIAETFRRFADGDE